GPAELRHVIEVHAVDAGDQRRDGDDRGPGRDLADVLVLADARLCEVRSEDARQHLAQLLNAAVLAQHVVMHVAEIRLHLRVELREAGAGEDLDRLEQRDDGAVQLQHVALPGEDPLGRVAARAREDVALDAADRRVERLDNRFVAVDDAIDDGIQHGARPAIEYVRLRLQLPANTVEVELTVANGDDEVIADEEEHLAEADVVGLGVPTGGLQDEQK